MINGNGNGITTGTPGMTIVNTNLVVDALTSIDVALRFTPPANQTNTVTDVTAYFLGIPISTFKTTAESPSASAGVDSSPGGTSSISDALGDGGGNQILIDFLDALEQDLYSFIPTMSSLAINNPNWFAVPNLNDSPFVNFYIPNQNEPHVTITAASAQFAMDEIRNGVLGISENQLSNHFVLSPNPVKNSINLTSSNNNLNERLTARVYSITGQKLMEETWTNVGRDLQWNHNLASGIYLLNLSYGDSVQTIKMIVQ